MFDMSGNGWKHHAANYGLPDYGRQKAGAFRSLLEKHLKNAASIVENVKQQNAKAVEQYMKLWYSNADQTSSSST